MTDTNPFRAELNGWQKVRRTYPGWLALPDANRGTMVREIDQGLQGGLIQALINGILPDWSAEEHLIAWSELSWRLERALLPIPPEWVEKIEITLSEVAPCDALLSETSGFFSDGARSFICRIDLRQPWIDLAVAVLRHHREFRHAEPFWTWLLRLAPLDSDWDKVHHHRAYQEALWHLTFMNDAQALAIAANWRAERGAAPYWLARKAGMLAELGEIQQAFALWHDCRRRLQGATSDEMPFFKTSRESPVLQALLWLDDDKKRLDRQDAQERLRLLSNIDGWNYWNELGFLTKSDLEYREKELRRKANGDRSFWRAPSLWEPLAGVQCFRLAGELGLPLRTQNGGVSTCLLGTSGLAESFADLALASEDLAGTSLMRMRDKDFWAQRLDPVHLAVLPEELLADLRIACDNAWRQVEELRHNSSQAQALVERAGALLVQLVWRMEGDECKGWFARLLSLGDRAEFRDNFCAAIILRDTFKMLAGRIDSQQILEVIAESLTFPLPEEIGCKHNYWPEPLDGIRSLWSADATLPTSALPRVASLLDNAPASRSALFRLTILSEAALLPSEMAEKLASKLWNKGDELPDIYPLLYGICWRSRNLSQGVPARPWQTGSAKTRPPIYL